MLRPLLRRPPNLILAAGLLFSGCSSDAPAAISVSGADTILLADFNEAELPLNNAGEPLLSQYQGEGGLAKVTLDQLLGPVNGGLQVEVSQGALYLQFNSHNANGTRGFVREYVPPSVAWPFNSFNRLSFWMRNPANGSPLDTAGRAAIQFGTYVKRVVNPDTRSDETGGGHFYHHVNVPNTDTWTRIIINPHPHHRRGASGSVDQGVQMHPTGEAGYNYFDALTRFYVNETGLDAPVYPIRYAFDRLEFYRERRPENDSQVYSIAATYVPAQNRYIVTWSRPKDENTVIHEVRYSSRDIHSIGWAAATPAPGGFVKPLGWQGYNGMVYTTTVIKASGGIHFAIKPAGAKTFSQISLPALPVK